PRRRRRGLRCDVRAARDQVARPRGGAVMADGRSAWTSDELSRIGGADGLGVAPLPPDGSPRRPRTIWAVRHGDDIYVRSVNGPDSAWYRGSSSGTGATSPPWALRRTSTSWPLLTTSMMRSMRPTGRSTATSRRASTTSSDRRRAYGAQARAALMNSSTTL